MKRFVLLIGVVVVAGCGGKGGDTGAGNTSSRNVAKPLERALVVRVEGELHGTAQIRRDSNKQLSVTLALPAKPGKGLTAALERGSCGAPKGLQTTKPLGTVRDPAQSWSVVASLSELTASPLAVVLRRNGSVVACGQVRQA